MNCARQDLARSLVGTPGAIRVADGEIDGLRPKWSRGYGRWVRDVVVWTKPPLLLRNEILATDARGGSRATRRSVLKVRGGLRRERGGTSVAGRGELGRGRLGGSRCGGAARRSRCASCRSRSQTASDRRSGPSTARFHPIGAMSARRRGGTLGLGCRRPPATSHQRGADSCRWRWQSSRSTARITPSRR